MQSVADYEPHDFLERLADAIEARHAPKRCKDCDDYAVRGMSRCEQHRRERHAAEERRRYHRRKAA